MKDKRLKFFDKDPIPWAGKYELHDFYKTLLGLHATNPALRGGDPDVTTYKLSNTADDKIFSYLRKNGADEVMVILNLSRETVRFDITDSQLSGNFKNAFSEAANNFTESKSFEMTAGEYLVYVK